METIKEIKTVTDLDLKDAYSHFDGYEVITDKHVYRVLIANGQDCCEDWGYMSSEDNFDYFINTELQRVDLTNTALDKVQLRLNEEQQYGFDGGGIQFVDFVTDKGVLQFAVYNGHNGYYGHTIRIMQDEKVLLDGVL